MRRSSGIAALVVCGLAAAPPAVAEHERGPNRGEAYISDAAHRLHDQMLQLTGFFEREILSAKHFWHETHDRDAELDAYLALRSLEGLTAGFHELAHDRINHSYCALERPFDAVEDGVHDAGRVLNHLDRRANAAYAELHAGLNRVRAEIEHLDDAIDEAADECRYGRRGPHPGPPRAEVLHFDGPWVIGGSLSYYGVRNRGSRIELELPRGARVKHISFDAHDRIGGRHGAQLGIGVIHAHTGEFVSLTPTLLDVQKRGSRLACGVPDALRAPASRLIIHSDYDEAWVQSLDVQLEWIGERRRGRR